MAETVCLSCPNAFEKDVHSLFPILPLIAKCHNEDFVIAIAQ